MDEKEEIILTPEMEQELSNGKEEGEEQWELYQN